MSAIGIDLGTTNCCVAVVRNGQPEIIRNNRSRTTPSCLCFTENRKVFFGDDAKSMMPLNPERTIDDMQHYLGLKYNDKYLRAAAKKKGFSIVKDIDGNPAIPIKSENNRLFSLEDLSGMLLGKLRRSAEIHLDTSVTKAVIAVPDYFTEAQRIATKRAALLGGFESVRLLNESKSAVLSNCADYMDRNRRRALILDFGGERFDASIVEYDGSSIDTIAMSSDRSLGGKSVDEIIMDYALRLLAPEKLDKLIKADNKKMCRLRLLSEQAKITLSEQHEAVLRINQILPDHDINITLSRRTLDVLMVDIHKSILKVIKQCLKIAKIDKYDIDDLVLVGGSSKILSVNVLLMGYFKRLLKRSTDPEEAIAIGAAIEASMWCENSC